ncbi:MAG: hypothetical protein IIU65_05945 [Clostridia bacterium]|nr:hypothetical protein [Clostridia bacterium]
MITQIFDFDGISAENLILTRIKANSKAYEGFDFCKTYIQTNEKDEKCAIINIIDNSATVFMFLNHLQEELFDFLNFFGIKNLFCNFNFENAKKKSVLKSSETNGEKHYDTTLFPDYKSVFSLLKEEFLINDYNNFVSDLSFRLKHNMAKIICEDFGFVFTLWETKSSAVISAIAVNGESRNANKGSSLLQSIVYDLKCENKDIYVYCEESLEGFYIKNGFIKTGFIYTGELN